MANLKDMTIGLSFDKKSKQRLRAIAKHAGALADELEAIDNNMKPCKECGSYNYSVGEVFVDDKELFSHYIECHDCGAKYHDELPIQHEGSE